MDFHTLSRRDLQALCKKNRIPANITNVAMADALHALKMVEGIEELHEAQNFQSPKTSQRTTSRKPVGPAEDQASPLPRSRRVTATAPGFLNLVDEEEKKDAAETPKVSNTRRRASKKEESDEILDAATTRKTTRKNTRASALGGVETQKEEKPVGLATGRRTRGATKKEVDLMSGGVRRSSRVRGIMMAPLVKDEEAVEDKEEAGDVVVEATDEDGKAEEQEERVGGKADQVEEKGELVGSLAKEEAAEEEKEVGEMVAETTEEDGIAAEEEKVGDEGEQVKEKGAGDIVDEENDLGHEEVVIETKNEERTVDVAKQVEEKEMKDIMEVETKSFEKSSCDDFTMVAHEDSVVQEDGLLSEEAVAVETTEEERLHDQEENIDDQAEHEEEEAMKDNLEETKSLAETPCNDLIMAVDEKSVHQENDLHPEEMIVVETIEEEILEDKVEVGEELDDTPEEEEEQIDDQAGEEKEKEEEILEDKVEVEEELNDTPEQEEEQIDNPGEEKVNETKDTKEDEIKYLENTTDIKCSHVEEKKEESMEASSELVHEASRNNEESPIRGLISSNPIAEDVENVQRTTDKENQAATHFEEFSLEQFPILEESEKDTDDVKIGELIDNPSDLNLSSKDEIKVDVGILIEESNNKENTEMDKSKTEKKNYENMSLRKLKAAYKEAVITMNNKGEEKRTALKAINENCF